MPEAFVPTRRAPLPPQPQSWIDLSDDDDEEDSVIDKPAGRTAGVAPAPSVGDERSNRLEREIMRMLQFNEEREVEARIIEEKKKKRNSSLSLGGFFGRLRRTASTAGRVEAAAVKRASYFDYFG